MKKRLFGILLMLAVLVAVCTISVSAVDEDFFSGTGYCECCDATVAWQPLTQELVETWNGNYDPANGNHYYVAETTVTTPKGLTVDTGETLHLHLNGNTFKRNGVRVATVNGQLAVMDHAGNKGILQAGANNTSTGGVVRLNKSGGVFELFGGNVKMVSGTHTEADNGGCVYMVSGTRFTMHDGTITGGKSDGSGGSLYVASGATATLHAGTITGGEAKANGGNIYNAGTLVLGDCAITGGVAEIGTDLYIANTGSLKIKPDFAGAVQATFDETLLPATLPGGVLEAAVATCEGAFPGKIYLETQTRETYLYGQENDTKVYIYVDLPENTPLPTTCAHCDKAVTWLPLTKALTDTWAGNYDPAGGTHYYVAEDMVTINTALTVAAGEELCLHLNGRDFFRDGTRAIAVTGTLNLMDHASNRGTVSGYGDNSSTGCVIRVYKGGNVNMYGGTVKMLPGSTTAKSFAGNGGCVYMAEDAGTFTMHGGIITDGKASVGGNVYVCKNATFVLKGGTITNGQTVTTAPAGNITVNNKHGGNIYLAGSATMVMTGGTVENGVSAGESGGNIMCNGTFTMSGGTLTGGKARLAGNLYIAGSATGNINGGTVTGGEATDRGGNIYMSSTSSRLNMTAGTISNGKSTNKGGNLCANNGVANLTGGTVTGGSGSAGGNISVNAGANLATNHVKLANVTVTGGTATGNGDNINVTGTLILDKGTVVEDGNIFMDTNGKLQVETTFTGEALINFAKAHLPTPIQGGNLTQEQDSCTGPFTGKLYVENLETRPFLYGKTGDSKLYVTGAARVAADGTHIWYTDNTTMMAALDGSEDYICAASGDLKLTGGNYLVDLAGQNVNVTGSGSVTFFDSANADFVTYGTATVTGVTVKNKDKTTVKDNMYYTLRENGSYSFHLLKVALTNVNIRPSSTGIYYDGVWGCDEKLADMVDSFGVAVSLAKMPDAKFATDSTVLATAYTAQELATADTKTGVIIEDILMEGEDAATNDGNGRKPIYARAYLKFTDGTVIMSDMGAAESLHSALVRLDQLIDEDPYIYRHYKRDGQNFVESWQDKGMASWELKHLLPSARLQESAEEAEVLKVLILGSSRSVNTFYMLYDVFKDQMPDQEFVFGIMYYSGCSMTMHRDFIKQDACVYRYYRNTDGLWDIQEPVTMDYGLKDQKWDIIFLQAGSGDLANQMNMECRLFITDYVDKMIPDHPHAFWFHTTWFNSTDPALYVNANTTIDPTTVDQHKSLTQSIDVAKDYVFGDPMFVSQICSGTPLMYALKVLEVPEIELYRDHTHLSDYGSLLVGYSFYNQLTGNPVTEVGIDVLAAAKRQPQYKNKGDLTITQQMKDMILQTAAYNAENPWTVPVKE